MWKIIKIQEIFNLEKYESSTIFKIKKLPKIPSLSNLESYEIFENLQL